jgi:hypothetical protein
MTRLEIAKLACRILALWVLAQGVSNLGALVALFAYPVLTSFNIHAFGWMDMLQWGVPAVFYLLQIVMCLFFWFGADWLAHRMVSHDPSPVVGTHFTQQNAMAVALVAVGTMTLIPELQSVVFHVTQLLGGLGMGLNLNLLAGLISAAAMAAVSCLLIFRPSGVVRLILRARSGAEYRGEGTSCLKCGYDLRASPERCPECGTVPPRRNSDVSVTTTR